LQDHDKTCNNGCLDKALVPQVIKGPRKADIPRKIIITIDMMVEMMSTNHWPVK
jgi:hypothetical protein